MDIELSKEDLVFQKEVEDFLAEHLPKGAEIWSKRAEWFDALKAKGWDVPNWPEKHGGPGWSATQHFIWDQITSQHTMPVTIPFGQVMLAPILMKYGSEEQINRFLPDIRDNKTMWCQGYSEPGAGSDLASLQTKAELTEDGKHYIVNGTKIWTTMGHIANWIFCLTRSESTGVKQEGITFL
ncbi:MAG: acyl-CoA dehydrogenase family protein, partial [Gammaproteobacteria bacterium]|nr:acyl-CoA dehydrogenase family protein [Gammaproteobacteria bacterium]